MKKNKLFLFVASFLLLFGSCSIDKDYDLSACVDMNVTLGGDSLSFPYSSTDTFSLSRIVSLENRKNVYINDEEGNDYYYFHKESQLRTYKVYTTAGLNYRHNVSNFILVNDMPEMLYNKGTCFDVSKIKLLLEISNPGSNKIEFTESRLMGVKYENGKRVETSVDIDDFTILPNTERMSVCFNNMCDVMKNIPDTIYYLAVATESADGPQVDDYNVSMKYTIDAPFAFGKDFCIVYEDSVTGMGKLLDDYSFQTLVMNVDVCNEVPLNINLIAEALGQDGATNTNIDVEIIGTVKAASKNIGGAEMSTLQIIMKGKTRDSFKKFDGIRYKAVGFATETQKDMLLMGNQCVRVSKCSLTVVGGVDFDLN